MRSLLLGLLLAAGDVWASTVDDCPGYKASNIVKGDTTLTADLTLAGTACNVYGTDIADLKLKVEYQTSSRLHVHIYDASEQVYQVHESVLPRPSPQAGVSASTSQIQFSLVESPFSFAVTRTSSGEVLFNTTGAQLIFESQYVRLRTSLPANPNLYGLGEHSDDFRFNTAPGYQRTLWNTESPFIPRHANLYGSHPNYVDYRGAKGTHGVFLLSSEGMNVNVNTTAEGTWLEYNTIGGTLDFYFFAGPDPADVSRQYAEVVGRPAMVPYWSFGFHQCKYGWPNVDYVNEVVSNYSKAGIPLEVMWGDIDYMDHRQDFTLDPTNYPLEKMRELVGRLHAAGQKYVMMLDPGIHRKGGYGPFESGVEAEVFLKAEDGSWYRGSQWAGEVVWPDWLHPNTQAWWTGEIQKFFDPETGLDIDGLWNDMNEASNFCQDTSCDPTEKKRRSISYTGSPSSRIARSPDLPLHTRQTTGTHLGLPNRNLFTPAYRISNHRGDLSGSTIYTNISNADGTSQYDTHNFYGSTMAATSREALISRRPARRPFVLTRSTFAGSGAHSAHWFGDNYSAWDDYRISIKQMLAFVSVHQVAMVGSDVCGFNGNAQETMCGRWAVMAAWQPFYRNHADISAPSQEFYRWESVARAAKRAVETRLRVLDYIYTAMERQSRDGTPAVAPVWGVYPGEEAAAGVQTQWFLGDAVLVAPVVEDDGTGVDVYLPDDVFYDFWTGSKVVGEGKTVRVEVPELEDIPVYIRGGSVVPMRVEAANTTAELRTKNFEVVVAPGKDGKAAGLLYLDDGESLDVGENKSDISFAWDGSKLTVDGTFGYKTDVVLQRVTVWGGKNATVKEGSWSLNGPFVVNVGGACRRRAQKAA